MRVGVTGRSATTGDDRRPSDDQQEKRATHPESLFPEGDG
jgi:hypothetical protein